MSQSLYARHNYNGHNMVLHAMKLSLNLRWSNQTTHYLAHNLCNLILQWKNDIFSVCKAKNHNTHKGRQHSQYLAYFQ